MGKGCRLCHPCPHEDQGPPARTRNFHVGYKIGSGSFGDIYLGTHVNSGEQVAIKMENVMKTKPLQLQIESKVYKHLHGGEGIPNLRWFGIEGNYNVLVLDLLGPSLEELFEKCGRQFQLKTVLLIAIQLITRLEYCHSKNFLHRDVKPDNFLTQRGEKTLYMIDFGFAKKFRDSDAMHIPYRENKNLLGTPRYASINNHFGCGKRKHKYHTQV